tara:strand:- start:352 stop:462 length:111 start_codon:yes stop_codon:yes gene_type:complete
MIKETFETIAFLFVISALFYSLKYADQIDQIIIALR